MRKDADRVVLHRVEMLRRSTLTKPYPSKRTRKQYRTARQRCGANERKGAMLWGNLSRDTSFAWKCATLEENARAMILMYRRVQELHEDTTECQNMQTAIFLTFGIARGDQVNPYFKDGPFTIPRSIGMAVLHADGVKSHTMHQAFKFHHKSIKHMIQRGSSILGEWINEQNFADWGFASFGQSPGRVQVSVCAEAQGDGPGDEARCPDHCG